MAIKDTVELKVIVTPEFSRLTSLEQRLNQPHNVNVGLNTDEAEAKWARLKQTLSTAITPKINESQLYSFNNHIDLKLRHWAVLKQKLEDGITPTIDFSKLNDIPDVNVPIYINTAELKSKLDAVATQAKIELEINHKINVVFQQQTATLFYNAVKRAFDSQKASPLQRLISFAGAVASAPLKLAGSAATGAVQGIGRGFFENIGKGFSDELRVSARDFTKSSVEFARSVDKYLIGEKARAVFLSELIRSGSVGKASTVASEFTEVADVIKRFGLMGAIASAPANNPLKVLRQTAPEAAALFESVGKKLAAQGASRKDLHAVVKQVMEELRPQQLIDEFLSPIAKDFGKGWGKFIGIMQAYRVKVAAETKALDRSVDIPNQDAEGNVYTKLVQTIGGAQFLEGEGGRSIAARIEPFLDEATKLLAVQNPDTDNGNKPNFLLDTLMQVLAPALEGVDEAFKNTVKNALRQGVSAVDPTFTSTAAVDALSNILGAKEKGYDDFAVTSYSLGGSDLIKFKRAADLLGVSVRTLAQAYPYLNLTAEAFTDFYSVINKADPLNFPFDSGFATPSDTQRFYETGTPPGIEAHADKHLYKSTEFLALMNAVLGTGFDLERSATAVSKYMHGVANTMYEVLGSVVQLDALLKTGDFDLTSKFKGSQDNITGLNAATNVAEKLANAQTTLKAQGSKLPPEAKLYTEKLIQRLLPAFESLREALIEANVEGITEDSSAKDVFGVLKVLEQGAERNKEIDVLLGKITGEDAKGAYFAGKGDPTPESLKSILVDLAAGAAFFNKGQFGESTDKLRNVYAQLEKAIYEIINTGSLSPSTAKTLEAAKLPEISLGEKLDALFAKSLNPIKDLKGEESYRTLATPVPDFVLQAPKVAKAYNTILKSMGDGVSAILPPINEFILSAQGMSGAIALLTKDLVFKTDLASPDKIASQQEVEAYNKLQGRYSPLLHAQEGGKYMVTERLQGTPVKAILDEEAKAYYAVQEQIAKAKKDLEKAVGSEDKKKLTSALKKLEAEGQKLKREFNEFIAPLYRNVGELGGTLQKLGVAHNDLASSNVFVTPQGEEYLNQVKQLREASKSFDAPISNLTKTRRELLKKEATPEIESELASVTAELEKQRKLQKAALREYRKALSSFKFEGNFSAIDLGNTTTDPTFVDKAGDVLTTIQRAAIDRDFWGLMDIPQQTAAIGSGYLGAGKGKQKPRTAAPLPTYEGEKEIDTTVTQGNLLAETLGITRTDLMAMKDVLTTTSTEIETTTQALDNLGAVVKKEASGFLDVIDSVLGKISSGKINRSPLTEETDAARKLSELTVADWAVVAKEDIASVLFEIQSIGTTFNDQLEIARPFFRLSFESWKALIGLAKEFSDTILPAIPGGETGAKLAKNVGVPLAVAGALSLLSPETYAALHGAAEALTRAGVSSADMLLHFQTAVGEAIPALKPFTAVGENALKLASWLAKLPGAGALGQGVLESAAVVGTGTLALKGAKDTLGAVTPKVIKEEAERASLSPPLKRIYDEQKLLKGADDSFKLTVAQYEEIKPKFTAANRQVRTLLDQAEAYMKAGSSDLALTLVSKAKEIHDKLSQSLFSPQFDVPEKKQSIRRYRGNATAQTARIDDLEQQLASQGAKVLPPVNLGSAIVEGAIEGVEKKAQEFNAAIEQLSDGGQKTFKRRNEIQSPSKVYSRFGEMLGEGAADGVEKSIPSVTASIDKLGEEAQKQAKPLTIHYELAIPTKLDSTAETLSQIAALVSKTSNLGNALTSVPIHNTPMNYNVNGVFSRQKGEVHLNSARYIGAKYGFGEAHLLTTLAHELRHAAQLFAQIAGKKLKYLAPREADKERVARGVQASIAHLHALPPEKLHQAALKEQDAYSYEIEFAKAFPSLADSLATRKNNPQEVELIIKTLKAITLSQQGKVSPNDLPLLNKGLIKQFTALGSASDEFARDMLQLIRVLNTYHPNPKIGSALNIASNNSINRASLPSLSVADEVASGFSNSQYDPSWIMPYEEFIDDVKDVFGIASPSKVFESIRRDVDAGFSKGDKRIGYEEISFISNALSLLEKQAEDVYFDSGNIEDYLANAEQLAKFLENEGLNTAAKNIRQYNPEEKLQSRNASQLAPAITGFLAASRDTTANILAAAAELFKSASLLLATSELAEDRRQGLETLFASLARGASAKDFVSTISPYTKDFGTPLVKGRTAPQEIDLPFNAVADGDVDKLNIALEQIYQKALVDLSSVKTARSSRAELQVLISSLQSLKVGWADARESLDVYIEAFSSLQSLVGGQISSEDAFADLNQGVKTPAQRVQASQPIKEQLSTRNNLFASSRELADFAVVTQQTANSMVALGEAINSFVPVAKGLPLVIREAGGALAEIVYDVSSEAIPPPSRIHQLPAVSEPLTVDAQASTINEVLQPGHRGGTLAEIVYDVSSEAIPPPLTNRQPPSTALELLTIDTVASKAIDYLPPAQEAGSLSTFVDRQGVIEKDTSVLSRSLQEVSKTTAMLVTLLKDNNTGIRTLDTIPDPWDDGDISPTISEPHNITEAQKNVMLDALSSVEAAVEDALAPIPNSGTGTDDSEAKGTRPQAKLRQEVQEFAKRGRQLGATFGEGTLVGLETLSSKFYATLADYFDFDISSAIQELADTLDTELAKALTLEDGYDKIAALQDISVKVNADIEGLTPLVTLLEDIGDTQALEELGAALNILSRSYNELDKQTRRSGLTLEDTLTPIRKQTIGAAASIRGQRFTDASLPSEESAANLGEEVAAKLKNNTNDFAVFAEQLKALEAPFQRLIAIAQAFGGPVVGQVLDSLGGLAEQLGLLKLGGTATFLALSLGVAAYTGAQVGLAQEVKSLGLQFVALGYDGEQSVERMFRLAQKTGTAFRQTASLGAGIAGSLKFTGLEGDTIKITEQIAKINTALQLGEDQSQRFETALVQMFSKGVVSLEEVRQQAAEAVPSFFPALARGLDLSPAQTIQAISAGEVSSAEAVPAALEELTKMSEAAYDEGIRSLPASLNRISNAMLEVNAAFGTTPLGVLSFLTRHLANVAEAATPILKALTPLASVFVLVGGAKALVLAHGLGIVQTAMRLTGQAIRLFTVEVVKSSNAFLLSVTEYVSGITGLKGAAAGLVTGGLIVGLTAIVVTIAGLIHHLRNYNKEFKDILKAINDADVLKLNVFRNADSALAAPINSPNSSNPVTAALDVVPQTINALEIKTVEAQVRRARQLLEQDNKIILGISFGGRENAEKHLDSLTKKLVRLKEAGGSLPTSGKNESIAKRFGEEAEQVRKHTNSMTNAIDDVSHSELARYAKQREVKQAEVFNIQAQVDLESSKATPNTALVEQLKMKALDARKALDAFDKSLTPTGGLAELEQRQADIEGIIKEREKVGDADGAAYWTQILNEVKQRILRVQQAIDKDPLLIQLTVADGKFQDAEDALLVNYNQTRAAFLNQRSRFAITEEQLALKEAKAEKINADEKIKNLNAYIQERSDILSKAPGAASIAEALGISSEDFEKTGFESASLEKLNGLIASIENGAPGAEKYKNLLEGVKELRQGLVDLSGAQLDSAEATRRQVQANVSYLASLRDVLGVVLRFNAAKEAGEFQLTANQSIARADLTRQRLGGQLSGSGFDLASAKLSIDELSQRLDFNSRQMEGLTRVMATLTDAEKAQAKELIGAPIEQASILQLKDFLARKEQADAKGEIFGNANIAEAVRQGVVRKELGNENLQLEEQQLEAARAQLVEVTASQLRQYRQSVRNFNNTIVDYLQQLQDQLEDTQTEIAQLTSQTSILESRNALRKHLLGATQSIDREFFQLIIDAVSGISDIINDGALKQSTRAIRDITKQHQRTIQSTLDDYASLQEQRFDLAGVSQPGTINLGNKLDTTNEERLAIVDEALSSTTESIGTTSLNLSSGLKGSSEKILNASNSFGGALETGAKVLNDSQKAAYDKLKALGAQDFDGWQSAPGVYNASASKLAEHQALADLRNEYGGIQKAKDDKTITGLQLLRAASIFSAFGGKTAPEQEKALETFKNKNATFFDQDFAGDAFDKIGNSLEAETSALTKDLEASFNKTIAALRDKSTALSNLNKAKIEEILVGVKEGFESLTLKLPETILQLKQNARQLSNSIQEFATSSAVVLTPEQRKAQSEKQRIDTFEGIKLTIEQSRTSLIEAGGLLGQDANEETISKLTSVVDKLASQGSTPEEQALARDSAATLRGLIDAFANNGDRLAIQAIIQENLAALTDRNNELLAANNQKLADTAEALRQERNSQRANIAQSFGSQLRDTANTLNISEIDKNYLDKRVTYDTALASQARELDEFRNSLYEAGQYSDELFNSFRNLSNLRLERLKDDVRVIETTIRDTLKSGLEGGLNGALDTLLDEGKLDFGALALDFGKSIIKGIAQPGIDVLSTGLSNLLTTGKWKGNAGVDGVLTNGRDALANFAANRTQTMNVTASVVNLQGEGGLKGLASTLLGSKESTSIFGNREGEESFGVAQSLGSAFSKLFKPSSSTEGVFSNPFTQLGGGEQQGILGRDVQVGIFSSLSSSLSKADDELSDDVDEFADESGKSFSDAAGSIVGALAALPGIIKSFEEGDVAGGFLGIISAALPLIGAFADGGTASLGSMMSTERAQSGRTPLLAVVHEGEEILTTKNDDAATFRRLKSSGAWELIKERTQSFAYGGTVGKVNDAGASIFGTGYRGSTGSVYHGGDTTIVLPGVKDRKDFGRSQTQVINKQHQAQRLATRRTMNSE